MPIYFQYLYIFILGYSIYTSYTFNPKYIPEVKMNESINYIVIFSLLYYYSSSISLLSSISSANCFSNLLCMKSIKSPNKIAETINIVLMTPLIEKDIRINMVEIINPEFRMTLWNSSV